MYAIPIVYRRRHPFRRLQSELPTPPPHPLNIGTNVCFAWMFANGTIGRVEVQRSWWCGWHKRHTFAVPEYVQSRIVLCIYSLTNAQTYTPQHMSYVGCVYRRYVGSAAKSTYTPKTRLRHNFINKTKTLSDWCDSQWCSLCRTNCIRVLTLFALGSTSSPKVYIRCVSKYFVDACIRIYSNVI